VVFLKPDQNGAVAPEAFANAIDEKTIFVSAMAVNNELGSFMPIGLIADLIKAKKAPALFHCDAVQAYGNVKLTPKKHGVDLMTVSSHKVHGPKGTGALYVKKGVKILPRAFGGSQELTLRPGTQGVPTICAFGAAVSEFSIEKNYLHIRKLNSYAREALADIPEITINSSPDCLPYVLNISTNAVKSETMMHFLAQRNIFVSSGSACKKGQKSYVLKEIGLPDSQIDTALRISFCKHNTIEDVDALTEGIRTGIETLAGVVAR
jgi:cysteine desulfurase